jgi:hypothetical protein
LQFTQPTPISTVLTGGVNHKICEKLGLQNCKILQPASNQLKKLVTFIPVKSSMLKCVKPYLTQVPEILGITIVVVLLPKDWEVSGEMKIQIRLLAKKVKFMQKKKSGLKLFSRLFAGKIIEALLKIHPYEEVAYDIYPIENKFEKVGMGMTGTFAEPKSEIEFLNN